MATTGIFNGTILVLKYNNGIIGHTTSCSLSLSADTPEATSKASSGFSEFIPGVMSGEISFEGLIKYDDSKPNGQYRKDVDTSIFKDNIKNFTFKPLSEGIKEIYELYKTR